MAAVRGLRISVKAEATATTAEPRGPEPEPMEVEEGEHRQLLGVKVLLGGEKGRGEEGGMLTACTGTRQHCWEWP